MPGDKIDKFTQMDSKEEVFQKTKNDLNSLHANLTEGLSLKNEVLSKCPKKLSVDSVKNMMNELDFSNEKVHALINKIPEQKRFDITLKAAKLKNKFKTLKDDEALQRAMQGENEYDLVLQCHKATNYDTHQVLKRVGEIIDKGKDPFEGIPIPENVLFSDERINNSIDKNRVLSFDKLPPELKKKILHGMESKYETLFEKSISEGSSKNPNIPVISLFDDDEIFQLYVKYYNVKQLRDGKPTVNHKSLSDKDKQALKEQFKVDLDSIGYKVEDVDENLKKENEEREKRIREENQRLLEEFKRKTGELNASLKSDITTVEKKEINEKKTIDMQSASGADIAENAGLGKQLNEQYRNKNLPDDPEFNDRIFSNARSKFIESNANLKNSITKEIMLNLYDQNSNTIKNLDDKARDELKNVFKDSSEIEKIYNQLLSFPNQIDSAKKELTEYSESTRVVEDEKKNNEAVGTVIDNVRNVFSGESKNVEGNLADKGLQLDENNPVKIEGNNLMMFGKFNGADTTVRYDLESGEIFMNSFLQYSNNDTILLGNKSLANCKVGELVPFDNILTNNESLNSQINLLSNAVIDSSKKQSAKNSIVNKFMKTFNIITNSQEIKDVEIHNGSNLFDLFQIIENSDPAVLEEFQLFMEKIMKYSGLNRGKNNLNGKQENDKTSTIFDKNNHNKYASLLRDNAESFSANPNIFKGKVNFESSSQLGFAQTIIQNVVNDAGKPNWKLDSSKMNEFIKHLETDGKELYSSN